MCGGVGMLKQTLLPFPVSNLEYEHIDIRLWFPSSSSLFNFRYLHIDMTKKKKDNGVSRVWSLDRNICILRQNMENELSHNDITFIDKIKAEFSWNMISFGSSYLFRFADLRYGHYYYSCKNICILRKLTKVTSCNYISWPITTLSWCHKMRGFVSPQ